MKEVVKITSLLIGKDIPDTPPTLVLPANRLNDCCGAFSLKALAMLDGGDEFTNDRNEFYFYFGLGVASAVMTLERWNGVAFVSVATLNSNAYGSFKPLGFFTNSFNQNFISYILEWQLVIQSFGAGSYRVKCTTPSGDVYSREYCLNEYTADRANGTVRMEFLLNDIVGDTANDYGQRDFGQENILQQYRFSGCFDYTKSAYENDYIQYQNGQNKWVSSTQEPEYNITLQRLPFFVHDLLRVDMMQCESVKITDYNTDNFAKWVNKEVQPNSEYAPQFYILQSKLATVDIQFKQFANNLKKYRG